MVWLLLAACGKGSGAAWWDVEVGYDGPLVIDTADGSGSSGDSGIDTEPEDLSDQNVMLGDLQQTSTGAEASVRFRYVEDQSVLCDVRYASTKIRQVDCAACFVAFSLTLEQEELLADGGACGAEGWSGLGGEAVYVGVDMDKNSYRCVEGCTDGSGEWAVAGSASFAEDGFSFVIDL